MASNTGWSTIIFGYTKIDGIDDGRATDFVCTHISKKQAAAKLD